MTTTLNPPPVPPAGPENPRPSNSAGRVITILTALLGVGVLVAVVWGGMRSTFAASNTSSETQTLAVGGVTDLDVDVAATTLSIRFDDVPEASLEVRDSDGGPWTFERSGGTLRVETPRGAFVSWFGSDNGRAVLTLPAELEGADAAFDLGAGNLTAAGEFGELDLGMGAGEMTVSGSAASLVADVSAGRANVDLEGVRTANLQLAAGDMVARLGGDAPSEVRVSVSAGSLELTLPDEEYDVTSDVSAGEVDNGLRTASGASAQVSVEVAAGSARLIAD
jgi:hypothetical protein